MSAAAWDAPDDGPSNSDDSDEEIQSSSEEEHAGGDDGAGPELDHRGNPLDKPNAGWTPQKQRAAVNVQMGGEKEVGYYVRKLAQAEYTDVQPESAQVHTDGARKESMNGWVDYEYELDPALELPNCVSLSLTGVQDYAATLPTAGSYREGASRQGAISGGGSVQPVRSGSGKGGKGGKGSPQRQAWSDAKAPAVASKYGLENLATSGGGEKEEEFGLVPHAEIAHNDVPFSILFGVVVAATVATAAINLSAGWGTCVFDIKMMILQ